ncbi:hypothetical protein Ddc_00141 [Ditylenchus destructor]|nr:hypothetical protein Ddc_00141 [Ditylenchus destructor]
MNETGPEAKKGNDVKEQKDNKGQSDEQKEGPSSTAQDDVVEEEEQEEDEEQETGATDLKKDKKKSQTGKTRTKKNTKKSRHNRKGRKDTDRGQLPTCEDKYDGCKFRAEDCISMKTRRWRRAYKRCRKTCNRCKNELIDVGDVCKKEKNNCGKDEMYDLLAWLCPKTCKYTLKTRPPKPFGKNPKKKTAKETSEESSEQE